MRYLVGLVFVLALGVMGCNETTLGPTGGSGGEAGTGGAGASGKAGQGGEGGSAGGAGTGGSIGGSLLCEENGVTTTIGNNHPRGNHQLEIPAEDVAEGVEKTYDIQGNNTGHGHTVTVSADELTALDAGAAVMSTSSDTGAVGMDHTHPITLTCSSEASPT